MCRLSEDNGAAAVEKKSGREDGASWITGSKIDGMSTEAVKRWKRGRFGRAPRSGKTEGRFLEGARGAA